MRKLITTLIVFLIPILAIAQDWHGVPVDQQNIYKVHVDGFLNLGDSIKSNNYLRNIYITDSVIYPNGVQYNFYRSSRLDKNEMIDTATGPTWLGRLVYRKTNGDEIYLNKYLDTVLIKTKAGLNNTWLLGNDTSNTKSFMATVVSVDTLIIDGTLDSIKTISIQAYVGGIPDSSIYNYHSIVLSKNHGFIEILDLYAFPNFETAEWIGSFNGLVFPKLPYKHIRLDSTVINTPYLNHDILYQYQPGNEWIMKIDSGLQVKYKYDSIISVSILSANSIVVNSLRTIRIWSPPPNGIFFSKGVQTDTIYLSPFNQFSISASYEDHRGIITAYSNPYLSHYNRYHLIDYCQGRPLKVKRWGYITPVSGNEHNTKQRYQGLNLDVSYHYSHNGSTGTVIDKKLLYYNFNGCTAGNFVHLWPSSITTKNLYEDQFLLYPNPASNLLYLQTDIKWNELEIISLTGKVIKQFEIRNGTSFDIHDLVPGLYIAKIKTENGYFIQKILKQ